MQSQDINSEIDRILSSNIRDELLNHIPLEFLQSPAVQKKHLQDELSSVKSKQSFSRQNFEEDLFQKAQQILRLKETLEAELANINQIVQDNQKLTEANLYLKQELKKIKTEWRSFKFSIAAELNQEKEKINKIEHQTLQALQRTNKKSQPKRNNLSITSEFSFLHTNPSILKVERKNSNLQISSQYIVHNNLSSNKIKNNDFSTHQIDSKIKVLQQEVQRLKKQNTLLKDQISQLSRNQKITEIQNKNPSKQNINKNLQAIECYSSVFLKSVFSQSQNTDDVIRTALSSLQKPFFDELKEAKYFGKMILGKKNGNGLEEYKNGFHYQGNFSKNERHGIGKLFYKDKVVYAGEWKRGKFCGKGVVCYFFNLTIKQIEGNFKNGFLEGHSTITFISGHKIRALFKKNTLQQEGTLMFDPNIFPRHINKSQSGKVEYKRNYESEDKITFITTSGQAFNL